jgi:hypothetical protein
MTRSIHIHAFASVKGGVGKTTLALLTAHDLAERKSHPLLLDLDLTSTSLADAHLGLRAPELRPLQGGGPGTCAINQEPAGLLDEAATTAAKHLRARAAATELPDNGALAVPYANDLLSFLDPEGRIDRPRADALTWRKAEGERLGVIPSSPNLDELADAAGWFVGRTEDEWLLRLSEAFVQLLETAPEVTHLLLDLPPGLFGMAHHTLALLARLAHGGVVRLGDETIIDLDALGWSATVTLSLVCSPDPQDLLMACQAFRQLKHPATGIPDTKLVVNRVYTAESEVWSPAIVQALRGRGQDPSWLRDQASHFPEDEQVRRLYLGAAPAPLPPGGAS